MLSVFFQQQKEKKMTVDQFKDKFNATQSKVEPVVTEALKQLLQNEIAISASNGEVESVLDYINQAELPRIALYFTTGDEQPSLKHLVLFNEDLVLQFYAWMIAEEPAETITPEHFEGMKEGFEQVMGQIKMSVADDQANFVVGTSEIKKLENPEDIAEFLDDVPAMNVEYQLTGNEKSFSFIYLVWESTQTGQNEPDGQEAEVVEEEQKVTVQPAEFSNLGGNGYDPDNSRNIDMLLDVNLEVAVELDRKVVTVSELLKMGKGSILELEKSAGEPLDIFVNGRKFAEGEVVVIDDKFGIRITQLLSPKERIKSLG